jgi:hypothetical protein
MKTNIKLAALGALILATAGSVALAQPPTGGAPATNGPAGPGFGRRPPPPANETADQAQFPAPETGAPGDQFRPNQERFHQMLLDRYDTNKSGKLDDAEYIQIGKDVESGKLRLPPPPGFGRRGPGAPGQGPGAPGMRGPFAGGPGFAEGGQFGPPVGGPPMGGPQAGGPPMGGPRMGGMPGGGQFGPPTGGPGAGGPQNWGPPGGGPRPGTPPADAPQGDPQGAGPQN